MHVKALVHETEKTPKKSLLQKTLKEALILFVAFEFS